MDNEDPDKYYPYPTKGVRYHNAPAAADFRNKKLPWRYGGEDENYELMDVDEGAPPGRGDMPSYLYDDEDQEDSDMSSPERETIAEEPAKDDLDQGTFGVELEFLVVQCPRIRMGEDGELMLKYVVLHYSQLREEEKGWLLKPKAYRDPHPNDNRWISTTMTAWEIEEAEGKTDAYKSKSGASDDSDDSHDSDDNHDSDDSHDSDDEAIEYKRSQYTRNKLTRVLRDKGLTVIKWPEGEINPLDKYEDFVQINDFDESEASDDQREDVYPNGPDLREFRSVYDFNPFLSLENDSANINAALLKWQGDFEQFHKDRKLKVARTKLVDIEMVLDNCITAGWKLNERQRESLKGMLRDRLINLRHLAKQRSENERNRQIDPLHVPVPGLKAQYKAWTVTIDQSVDGNGMTGDRYGNTNMPKPLKEYYWFGAEVVSPVLPMGDERARQAIRDACGSLRDTLRCHKPMKVSTGLHIHLGHTKGWTLFQAKRFASFWYLAEKTILSLHREDRDADMKWCAKIAGGSNLWRALYSAQPEVRSGCGYVLQRNYPPAIGQVYMNQFANNVPNVNPELRDEQKTILFYIWHYNTITELHEALGQNMYCRPGVKWRIRGRDSSLQGYGDDDIVPEPGTIEVRIMQGTLDADHINNWIVVLERVVHVVRTLSDDDFSNLLDAFLRDQTRERLLELLGVPDDIRQYWRDGKRRDENDRYWEYPDHDVVDWKQPFDVPGYKATHGAFWD
ncbi:hypothetical protein F4803DRAFT_551460 [Xylaria telfairii]|nr:hypothetical protein F4803DRAFT_551460 [Xylaria telfairii]